MRWGGAFFGFTARVPFFSTVPGEPSLFHDRLLDEALARIRVETPANLKVGEAARIRIEKHNEAGRVNGSSAHKKGDSKGEAVVRIRLPRPCHGKKCAPPPPPLVCGAGRMILACGTTSRPWRLSEQVYSGIEYNCWDLRQRLQEAENRAESLRAQQQIVCSAAPLSADCQAATRPLAKLESRVERLREQYERCVASNLRSAVFSQAKH